MPRSKFTIPKWWDCTWRRIACDKDACRICGRIKRDRQRHIAKGEDPDAPESVFEDVSSVFQETLSMIKKDAQRLGIDFEQVSKEEISEAPEAETFPLYRRVYAWHKEVTESCEEAYENGALWTQLEAAADVLWYKNTLCVKTYRQLCNRWELDRGDEYAQVDYDYTKYVLRECCNILCSAFSQIITPHDISIYKISSCAYQLQELKHDILQI